MPGRECFHCKQWIEEGQPHDCWTTTEAALTKHLSEDLREAWDRLRETVVDFGEQRVYASHHSIMFSRASCYFFVRPKRTYLELCIFLGRPLKNARVRKIVRASTIKFAHLLRVTHRDEVEPPITDWLEAAYHYNVKAAAKKPARSHGGRARRQLKRGPKTSVSNAASRRRTRHLRAGGRRVRR